MFMIVLSFLPKKKNLVIILVYSLNHKATVFYFTFLLSVLEKGEWFTAVFQRQK